VADTAQHNPAFPTGASPAARVAALARSGTLNPAELPEACALLRAELGAISSFLPATIVRQHLEAPAPGRLSGEYWDGSVLFADMSGFTALSGRLSTLGKQGAEEISQIINALFGTLVDEVQRLGGELFKFGGDALTAFFHAATLGDGHALVAARAALALQERMAWFRAIETPVGTFALKLRVGVHSGRVFAAQVGDTTHMELVVTGHDINRVALAQEIAEPGEVVVSDATLALATGVVTIERSAGFHRLLEVPEARPAARRSAADALAGLVPDPCERLEDLLALADRIDALAPYLPHRLPRRFLDPAARAEVSGEFRPVTVLFANFAPFSAALDLLGDDAATAALVLNAYYRRAQAAVHRYGGIVNKVDMATSGDKLMALFGAPAAHEDDPERAVRCALDMRAALEEANNEIAELLVGQNQEPRTRELLSAEEQAGFSVLGSRFSLTQKIGINTGVVFAGLVGSARRHEYTVMGQPVNLAARLMAVAEPGTAVISPVTRRAVEGRFRLRDLAPARLKGVPEPVPLAEVLRTMDVAQEPRRVLARAAMVGRGAERDLLVGVGVHALRGSGQVVALSGEAGVGKSRLIEELLHQLVLHSARPPEDARAVPGFLLYSAECQSYEQNAPYAAARTLLHQLFDLELYGGADGTGAAAAVSRRVEALTPDMVRFAPLLGDVLGITFEETALTVALGLEQRHDRLQDLIEALVLAEARSQPLVLIVDDLHWGDASSLDLISRIARAAAAAPLLLLLGYRADPQIAEPWTGLPHCTRLVVNELPAAGAAELLRELLGAPPPALATLLDKAQGNPFFLEEVVRGLVESGTLLREPAGWRLTRELDEAALPDSIEGLIVARLDRLEERSREVVQVAAVIGRRFAYPVLAGVMPQRHDLPRELDRLSQAELVQAEVEQQAAQTLAALAYLFKHALTRDVAYESILYARRRDLHRSVAREIEELHAGRLEEQLVLLARHWLMAEEWERAFDYHVRAGRQAQRRFANREAITLFQRALEIAERLERTEPRTKNQEANSDESRARFSVLGSPVLGSPVLGSPVLSSPALGSPLVELHERLGVVHALIGEYDAALARYETALRLYEATPGVTDDERIRLHHHIARVYEKRAAFDTAFEWVERALAFGEGQGEERTRCLLLGAGLHQRQGRYAQSLEWGERARALAERIDSPRLQAEAFMLLGGTYGNLGDTARAHQLTAHCLSLYEQVQDLPRLADAHNNMAIFAQDLGRLQEARHHFEAGAAIKESVGDVYGQAMVANNLGSLLLLVGELDEATVQYRRSLAMFERLGSLYATGVLEMNLGAVQLQRGELAAAETHLERSAALYKQAGAEDFLPELERYRADLALRRGELPATLALCQQALATARRLEARLEEGLTLRVLGRILVATGDASGAWDALAHSLSILREAGNPLEIGRTLLAIAALAQQTGRTAEGHAALREAIPALEAVGARGDLDEARALTERSGYEP
jgi:class 3 adenylate cyclase/tetratricopeptide (TPR) repeat protein